MRVARLARWAYCRDMPDHDSDALAVPPGLYTRSLADTGSHYIHAGHDPRSPLVPTRIPGLPPLVQACCADRRWWIVILDRERLRRARSRAGLSQRQLAAAAGLGRATISALESQDLPRCHFRTRGRIAAALGTHPKAISAPGDPLADVPGAVTLPSDRRAGPGGLANQRFLGRHDQVREARAFLRGILGDSLVADAALLVGSELAANAVQHSRSAQPGGTFTVRGRLWHDAWAWVEVQDDGGRWKAQRPGSAERGRGLVIIDELASYWDIREDDARRVICARVDCHNRGDRMT
jgi:anti-sigma regulatory factor (Ser/Thr protein kinase)/DNA-binding XRE family transcriptional regulator